MKTRAEVLREKQQKKASAEERTIPLLAAAKDAVAVCDACGEESPASACTTRADGFAECPACGAPVKLSAPKKPASAEPSSSAPAAAVKEPKDPHKKFCGECGSEWPFVNGLPFINCGHKTAERIEDPRKARKFGPPAGLQTRSEKERERLDAEDAKKTEAAGFTPPSAPAEPRPVTFGGPGPAVISGNRISIPWGEARMPIDQWNNFKCGGHIITAEVPEGADRREVARRIIADLEAIADLLFERQRAWYEKKLKALSE